MKFFGALLGSNRFWMLTVALLLIALQSQGVMEGTWIDEFVRNLLILISGVRTVDRLGEKIGGK